jgi:hypothetical protein
MEETKNILLEEEKLYKALEYYRIHKDIELIEERIKDLELKDSNSNKFNKVINNIINPIKKQDKDSLAKLKNKALDNLEDFNNKNKDIPLMSKEELKESVEEFYKEDTNNEARILMGLKLLLQSEYSFACPNESEEKVSDVLFDNLTKLNELKEELKKNYYSINKKNLKEFDKSVWKGLGIVAAASLLAGPIGTFAATKNKDVKASLDDLAYAGENLGFAAITLSMVTLNVFLIGASAGMYGISELKKDENLKKEYRKISPDSLAMRFAIKATIIEELKKKGDLEVLNVCFDDCLTILDNYRADAEYMMIVEHKDIDIASRKITICNNFVVRLNEISK